MSTAAPVLVAARAGALKFREACANFPFRRSPNRSHGRPFFPSTRAGQAVARTSAGSPPTALGNDSTTVSGIILAKYVPNIGKRSEYSQSIEIADTSVCCPAGRARRAQRACDICPVWVGHFPQSCLEAAARRATGPDPQTCGPRGGHETRVRPNFSMR